MYLEINDRRPKGYRTRLIDLLPPSHKYKICGSPNKPSNPLNCHTVKKFSDIIRFLRYDMWRVTATEFDGFFQKLGYNIIRTIVLVVRGFASKNLNDKAKSLTYSLIFAIVPILAMIVAVAKGFGVADVIETQLNKSFLGETNLVPTIMAMV